MKKNNSWLGNKVIRYDERDLFHKSTYKWMPKALESQHTIFFFFRLYVRCEKQELKLILQCQHLSTFFGVYPPI